ncbi:hypothetical protein DS884_11345 [Tenacibaculum sp. E3R01]|uniref:hypothetical protein n=1 Tax=unclassified Tenacibaculum TaxID=2635139 RepID=UPI00089CBFE9|nr:MULTISPECIES: hypothetical protein [unclassified Tenacibaculum]RBW57169.1 hypothetical protein DS884_11345 [Tenacibaculum sp. E3R01]SEE28064.1 hypothetical protein SAMN04487765_1994 [Tenacibaculum sp. MAR_2010_89]
MKKIIGFLVFVISISTSVNAQKEKKERMTVEQQTELAVKKMALKLDLTDSQQRRVKPLLAEQINEKKELRSKRKAMKESGKKPSADERYAVANSRLNKLIAFKTEMKSILNEKQYERFEKMTAKKMHKRKKKAKKKMHKRSNRH